MDTSTYRKLSPYDTLGGLASARPINYARTNGSDDSEVWQMTATSSRVISEEDIPFLQIRSKVMHLNRDKVKNRSATIMQFPQKLYSRAKCYHIVHCIMYNRNIMSLHCDASLRLYDHNYLLIHIMTSLSTIARMCIVPATVQHAA